MNKLITLIIPLCFTFLIAIDVTWAEQSIVIEAEGLLTSAEMVESVKRGRFKLMGLGGTRKTTRFEFHNILFKFNSAELEPISIKQLNEVVTALGALGDDTGCFIEGHTDEQGSNHYNYRLSLSRAQAVQQYINEELQSHIHIETKGLGETTPLCTEATETCRTKNRRVEISIK